MEKFGVQIACEAIREAREKWDRSVRKFNSDVNTVMSRLLMEAARNYMSAEEVSKHSGIPVKRIRILMRSHGLDPKTGKQLLAKKAAETLAENAALLGVEPHEFDLMSPLAYLPMGSELRRFLETEQTVGDGAAEVLDTQHGYDMIEQWADDHFTQGEVAVVMRLFDEFGWRPSNERASVSA